MPLTQSEHKAFIWLPPALNVVAPAPISLFQLFLTDDMLNTIMTNTNLYALSKDAGSFGCTWYPIDTDDLVTWIALTVYIGLFWLSMYELCWNTNKRDPVHMISQYMKLFWY